MDKSKLSIFNPNKAVARVVCTLSQTINHSLRVGSVRVVSMQQKVRLETNGPKKHREGLAFCQTQAKNSS